jgi:ABC-type uncharacterized transport system substrate-binding protein
MKRGIRVLGALLLLGGLSRAASGEGAVVSVVLSADIDLYRQAVEGFKHRLEKTRPGVQFTMHMLPFENEALRASVAEDVRKVKPALLLAVGGNAAKWCRRELSEFKNVFCMVSNPSAQGLSSGGVALELKPAESVGYIQSTLRLRSIAVVHNPETSGPFLADIQGAALPGVDLLGASGPEQIPKLMSQLVLRSRQVDAIFILPDKVLSNPTIFENIVFLNMQRGIPVITTMPGTEKSGALAAVFSDPEDIGFASADMAARVLGGEEPESIPCAWAAKVHTTLNQKVADRLNIKFSRLALADAETVVK